MKIKEIINPKFLELMEKFEDELDEVSFCEGKLYLYSKKENLLNKIIKSKKYLDLCKDYDTLKHYDKSYDRYLGYYLVFF